MNYDYIVNKKTASAITKSIAIVKSSGGGNILLPPGIYDCTGSNKVNLLSNVNIYGDRAVLKGDGGLVSLINGKSIDNVEIMGLELDGNYSGIYDFTSGEMGMSLTGSNIKVKKCNIHNFKNRGINADYLFDCLFEENIIDSCAMGIRLNSNGSNLKFNKNNISNTHAGGITLSCNANNIVSDIIINKNIVDNSNVTQTIVAQPIVCYSNYINGLSGTIKSILVTKNKLTGNGKNHAAIRMGGDNILLEENDISNFADGILIRKTNNNYSFYSNFIIINNNNLKLIGNQGIVADVFKHLIINSNNIKMTTLSGVDSGISLGQDHGNVSYPNMFATITKNVVKGTKDTEFGMYMNNVNHSMINKNIFQYFKKDGIRVVDSTYNVFTKNDISNTGYGGVGYGMYFNSSGKDISDYNIIYKNILHNNSHRNLVITSSGLNNKSFDN